MVIAEKVKCNINDRGRTPRYITESHYSLNKTECKEGNIKVWGEKGAKKLATSASRRMVCWIAEYTRRWYER